MPEHRSGRAAGGHVPHASCSIGAARSEIPTVGGKRNLPDLPGMANDRVPYGLRRQINDANVLGIIGQRFTVTAPPEDRTHGLPIYLVKSSSQPVPADVQTRQAAAGAGCGGAAFARDAGRFHR